MSKYKAPAHDFDLVIVFPSGKEIIVQARPSKADVGYRGSLDFVFPADTVVTCWKGDDMSPAPQASDRQHIRLAKQLVIELP